MNAERLAEAVLEDLQKEFKRSPQSWAVLRRRLVALIQKETAPAPPMAISLAATERALGDQRLYTTHDVGQLLRVDASTVSKWIDKKKLLAFRTPGGHRRVRAQDLKAFCVEHEIPITGELAT